MLTVMDGGERASREESEEMRISGEKTKEAGRSPPCLMQFIKALAPSPSLRYIASAIRNAPRRLWPRIPYLDYIPEKLRGQSLQKLLKLSSKPPPLS